MQRGEGLPLLNISLVCHLSKINSKPDYVRLSLLVGYHGRARGDFKGPLKPEFVLLSLDSAERNNSPL